ncbi:MAG: TetR/AcrR family transcriptional regulator [Pseudomonadota bacterium]|nr:TetR/AcrR family transcriptional regulator [Pseudomonadota bacterium]
MERPGRPRGESDNRQQLLQAARQLFTRLPYQRVSVRMVAREAGVDPALVRYYFGSKGGLLETMLRETIAPAVQAFRHALSQPTSDTDGEDEIDRLIRTYYECIFIPQPEMPRMMIRFLSDPGDEEPYRIATEVVSSVIELSRRWMQQNLHDSGRLRPGTDPDLARLSLFSLMMFPLIAPPVITRQLGFEPGAAVLERLRLHNRRLLQSGILNPADPARGDSL